jgi:hypothetical protein
MTLRDTNLRYIPLHCLLMPSYQRAAIFLFQACRRLVRFGRLHSGLIMDTVQKIEQWNSARAASTVEPTQSRSYPQHPSSNSNSRESYPHDTEALEVALEQISCTSLMTADSDDEDEQGDVDWLQ